MFVRLLTAGFGFECSESQNRNICSTAQFTLNTNIAQEKYLGNLGLLKDDTED